MAAAAAIARWREARGSQKTRSGLIGIYFGVVLLLCKSVGATILAAVFIPIIAFLRAKRIATISAAACIIMLVYPAIRTAGFVPTITISELTRSFSTDRAGSFEFRLINEDQLLRRAGEKPVFGWGSWGRNRIYSPDDGSDLSVTDGAWIITLGTWGWVGYIAMFGLLNLGCLRILSRRTARSAATMAVAVTCSLLALNLIDSIPNSSIRALTWIIAGTLASVGSRQFSGRPIPSLQRRREHEHSTESMLASFVEA